MRKKRLSNWIQLGWAPGFQVQPEPPTAKLPVNHGKPETAFYGSPVSVEPGAHPWNPSGI